ncbi:MAG: hypothetical protein H0V76_10010 [Blastocatellia bacterium]|nr:hypothetical protein [Blastocatellia bacterium]
MEHGTFRGGFSFLTLYIHRVNSTKEIIKVAAAKQMTLQDRILQIDHIQARRFSKLTGDSIDIAAEGIIRHLRACARMDVNPDASAVREIIDDALNGRRVFAETSNDLLAAA